MRWRLVDRVDRFEGWRLIAGRKAVSLEEYSLLEPLGRRGVLPESLVLACCVEMARWLAAASSGFELTGALESVENMNFARQARPGAALEICAETTRSGDALRADCVVRCGGEELAAGRIGFALVPLAGSFDREWVEGVWKELRG
jgi:3-hydroxymyristoyl/3-hydroxydecanoyl-(acyl carrier protein) dehydratase